MDGAYRPASRLEGFLVEPIGEELLVYDQERRVAHSLNETAAKVWRACDGERDLDALAVECELDQATLGLALQRLRDVHLLQGAEVEVLAEAASSDGVSRRVMLRRSVLAGAGVGLSIPVIRSITAPSMAMAASGRSGSQVKGKAGMPCTSNGQCTPNLSICRGSCQRTALASCSHTSSCSHNASMALVCRGGSCNSCLSNGQCPASHPVCHNTSLPVTCR